MLLDERISLPVSCFNRYQDMYHNILPGLHRYSCDRQAEPEKLTDPEGGGSRFPQLVLMSSYVKLTQPFSAVCTKQTPIRRLPPQQGIKHLWMREFRTRGRDTFFPETKLSGFNLSLALSNHSAPINTEENQERYIQPSRKTGLLRRSSELNQNMACCL